ncbi:MAG TPA: cupin domain-containing protein [Thermomicrobiales bacterium]|jgi:uncharacterized RmlC-like cupin family protein
MPVLTATASTCTVVRSSAPDQSKQGLTCFEGISADRAGAERLCMHLVMIPPGRRAKPHFHADHETAIYVLSGEAEMWYGAELGNYLTVRAGDFLFIPAGMPHLPSNPSPDVPVVAVVARTDPNEQESVVLLPELARQFGA